MAAPVEIRIPKYPPCWDSCGSCRTEQVFIQSVLVGPGDKVKYDDTVLVLETGKVAVDIGAPQDGTIIAVYVETNDPVDEGDLVALLEVDA
jgi:biotin carboxyl carrier protein